MTALRPYRPAAYPQIEAGVSTYISSEYSRISAALVSLTESFAALQASVVTLSAPPVSFSAHKNSSNQTITSTATVQITFGTEAWDIGSAYNTSSSRWTPPAGLVRLNAAVTMLGTNAVDQSSIDVTMFKNGSVLRVLDVSPVSGTSVMAIAGSVLDQANGTDYYEVFLTLSAISGNQTVFGGPGATFFQGHVLK